MSTAAMSWKADRPWQAPSFGSAATWNGPDEWKRRLVMPSDADAVLQRHERYLRSFPGVIGVTCQLWRGKARLRVFVSGPEHLAAIPRRVAGVIIDVVDTTDLNDSP